MTRKKSEAVDVEKSAVNEEDDIKVNSAAGENEAETQKKTSQKTVKGKSSTVRKTSKKTATMEKQEDDAENLEEPEDDTATEDGGSETNDDAEFQGEEEAEDSEEDLEEAPEEDELEEEEEPEDEDSEDDEELDDEYTEEMLDEAENQIKNRNKAEDEEEANSQVANPQVMEIIQMLQGLVDTNVLTEKKRLRAARKNADKDILLEDDVTTAQEQELHEINAIAEAYRISKNYRNQAPRLIYGKVTSVIAEPGKPIMVAVIPENMRGFVKIHIPEMLFLAPCIYNGFKPELSDDEETRNLKRKYLRDELVAYIGANVSFVIQEFDEKEKLALANRVAAMDLITRLNYVRPNKKDPDNRPEIFEGLRVAAEVLAVRKDRIRINVKGVDTTITSGRELSSVALENLTNEFKVGDKFYVKVKEIKSGRTKIDRTYAHLKEIKVSKTEGEPKESDLFFSSFQVGQICGATVKRIEDNNIFVRLEDKMDAMCPIPTVGVPNVGSIVNVKITKMEDEKKFIYAKVI